MSLIFDSLQKAQEEREQQTLDEASAQTDTPPDEEREPEPSAPDQATTLSPLVGRVFWLVVLLSLIVIGFLLFQYQVNGVEPMTLLRGYLSSL